LWLATIAASPRTLLLQTIVNKRVGEVEKGVLTLLG
jgi:hypothetical protein